MFLDIDMANSDSFILLLLYSSAPFRSANEVVSDAKPSIRDLTCKNTLLLLRIILKKIFRRKALNETMERS